MGVDVSLNAVFEVAEIWVLFLVNSMLPDEESNLLASGLDPVGESEFSSVYRINWPVSPLSSFPPIPNPWNAVLELLGAHPLIAASVHVEDEAWLSARRTKFHDSTAHHIRSFVPGLDRYCHAEHPFCHCFIEPCVNVVRRKRSGSIIHCHFELLTLNLTFINPDMIRFLKEIGPLADLNATEIMLYRVFDGLFVRFG